MTGYVVFLRGINVGVAVMVRTADELAAVVAADPFGDDVDDPARYQVSFLSAEPASAAVEELEQACAASERVAVRGRHVYAWHPDSIRDSKLAKQIDSRHLGVETTARNWRTVTKMLATAPVKPTPPAETEA